MKWGLFYLFVQEELSLHGLMGPWLPTLSLLDPPAHIYEYETAMDTAQNQLSPSL